MGHCARRLAALACLFAPSAVRAQLAPVGVPAGAVRVDLYGALDSWDHRWRDGVREPLGADLSSPALGSDLLPFLSDADARISRITGLSGYRLNLGALSTDVLATEGRGVLGLALGLTRSITIFGNVPLVEARVQRHFAYALELSLERRRQRWAVDNQQILVVVFVGVAGEVERAEDHRATVDDDGGAFCHVP